MIWHRWVLAAALVGSLAAGRVAAIPPGGNYTGVYQGGYPGGGSRGERGVYIGGYPGGGSEGYNGVYQGGRVPDFPETDFEAPFFWPRHIDRSVAVLDVRVPAPAQLWFEGKKLTQAGGWHRYVSPPLTAGQRYTYHIRARWTENGKPVEVEREVHVGAGERVRLPLTSDDKRATRPQADRRP